MAYVTGVFGEWRPTHVDHLICTRQRFFHSENIFRINSSCTGTKHNVKVMLQEEQGRGRIKHGELDIFVGEKRNESR